MFERNNIQGVHIFPFYFLIACRVSQNFTTFKLFIWIQKYIYRVSQKKIDSSALKFLIHPVLETEWIPDWLQSLLMLEEYLMIVQILADSD